MLPAIEAHHIGVALGLAIDIDWRDGPCQTAMAAAKDQIEKAVDHWAFLLDAAGASRFQESGATAHQRTGR